MIPVYGKGAILKKVIVTGQVDRPTRLQDEVLRLPIFVKPIFWSFIAPYVKVYLMENGKCLVKKKTRTARRTLEPLYQQQLEFRCDASSKTLQVCCVAVSRCRVALPCRVAVSC